MNEKIIVNSDEIDVEVRSVTLLFNKQHLKIDYPERIMIDSFDTINYFERLTKIDRYTASLFKITVNDFKNEVTKENINLHGMGYKHLIGLFSLTFKYISENKKFGWRYPENYLHPSLQAELGDAAIILSIPHLFSKFIDCVNTNKFDECLKAGKNLKNYFFNVACNRYLDNF